MFKLSGNGCGSRFVFLANKPSSFYFTQGVSFMNTAYNIQNINPIRIFAYSYLVLDSSNKNYVYSGCGFANGLCRQISR
jgi:hypothetical protein